MTGIVARSAVFIAKIITPDLPKVARISISKYEFDSFLKMHFKNTVEVHAYDNLKCSVGDHVLVREIEEVPFKDVKIKYNVEKLLYKQGHYIDPLSGRQTAATEYVDDIARTTALFGRTRPYQKSSNE